MTSSSPSRTRPASVPAPRRPGAWVVAGFAAAAYLASSAALLYLVGFLLDVAVPHSVDRPAPAPGTGAAVALGRDLALVLLFGVSHSVPARPAVKRMLARVVPVPAHRSVYVLVAAATLSALMWWWTPLTTTIWRADGAWRAVLLGVDLGGWVLASAATFAVSHTDLFGLRQAAFVLSGREYTPPALTQGGLHRRMRHPLVTGLLVAVWATPTMTGGHLALAIAITLYSVVGLALEERDLLAQHGASYAAYRRATPAVLPLRRRRAS